MALIDLTAAQRAMWFAENLDGSRSVTVAHYLDIVDATRPLDRDLFRRSVVEGARDLQTAHTRFTEIDGVPTQYIDDTTPFEVVEIDLRDEPDPVAAALTWMRTDHRRSVDLLRDPVAMSAMIRVADDRTFWYMRGHHIAFDGYGALVAVHEAVDRYNAALAGRPYQSPPRATLADVVADDAAYRRSERHDRDRTFWAARASRLPERVTLATHPATAGASNETRVDAAMLDADLERRVRRCAGVLGASPAAVLTAAFAIFLARMSGSDDIMLSLPVTARTSARIKRSAGMVSNMVPLCIEAVRSATCADVVGSVTAEITAGLRHQRFRSEDIRAAAGFGDASGTSFGPLVNLLMFDKRLVVDGADADYHVLSTGMVDDLVLNVFAPGPEAPLEIGLHANPALYDQDELSTHRARFLDLLAQFVDAPDRPVADLDVLLPGEAARLGALTTGGAAVDVTGEHILAAVERQAHATPDAVAVCFGNTLLTYGRWLRACGALAEMFADSGVTPGDRVVVALDRSLEQVCAAHAAIALGAAYVPVDPAEPAERRAAIIDVVDPALVVDASFLAAHGIDVRALADTEAHDRALIRPLVSPDQPAYVIFTSGSTGVPKGVEIGHSAIEHRLAWMQHEHPLGADDVVLYKTPATFDVSVWELLWPLRAGARMVIAEPGGHRDPAYLRGVIDDAGVTVVHFVPSMLDAFLDDAADGFGRDDTEAGAPRSLPEHVRWVFTSGEALSAQLARRLADSSTATLVNLYGPTEAAIDVTAHRVRRDRAVVPIGRPVPGTVVRVLDAHLRPVPVGVAGELYLVGPQLATCYLGAPRQTADRFVADPFGTTGHRMYRTGDLVRWAPDGELEYLGRTDHQLKIRGQRVELGEIEAVIASMPTVEAVVVVARRDLGPAPMLVAYVRPAVAANTDTDTDTDAIRAYCRRRLPGHMVPVAVLTVDTFPTTRSGKLDQQALPAPDLSGGSGAHREPRTPAEVAITSLVAEALDRDRVSLSDNLFALGADSLLAARTVSRARIRHGLAIALTDVFDSADLADLASRARPIPGPVGMAPAVRPRPSQIPLSQAQTRLWFINRMAPHESTYNMSGALRLSHAVDARVLRRAIVDLLDRHEILRTVFPVVDGEPEQYILDTAAADRALGADTAVAVTADDLDQQIGASADVGFDLAEEIPFRYRLLTGDPAGDVIVLVLHHIAADGYSLRPLLGDLMTAYDSRRAGRRPVFAPLPLQYADVAVDRAATLGTAESPSTTLAEGIEFWRAELQGAPELLQLPTDRPRPRVMSSRGAHLDLALGPDLTAGLRRVAKSLAVTPFAVFQSALALTLSRLGATDDVCIGTAVAGRDDPLVAELVGMFVNTVVLRTSVRSDETVDELITAAHLRCARAMSHADVPFERVVDALAPHRSPSHSPLFQVALTVQPDQLAELSQWTGSAEVLDARVPSAKYDITVSVTDRGDDYDLEFSYATDLFDAASVRAIGDRVRGVLAQMVADPGRTVASVDVLDEEEKRRHTSLPCARQPETTLADLIVRGISSAAAAAPALTAGGTLSWAEVSAAANQIGRVLIDRGMGPGDVVAISIPRSHRSVVALLGVAMSGAAFVMVDPRLPTARRAAMVADSGARLVITVGAADFGGTDVAGVEEWVLDDLETELSIAGRPYHPLSDAERTRPIRIDDVAYLLFTSGSTGLPKAVAVTHAGLAELVAEQRRRLHVTADSRVLHVAAPGFDVVVWEIMLAVCSGAQLVISPPEVFAGPELEGLIARRRVTHAVATPSAWATVEPAAVACLDVVMTAGEACPPELAARWEHAGRPMLNLYGPAESTIWATVSRPLTSTHPITIGAPISGLAARVLDAGLRPVPDGVIGELYLAGRAIARGYHRRPGLSAIRFVADPFDVGMRMYRTGDLVSRTADGELIYHGRNDFQIKIRGMRVEPGEVDAVLTSHPDVELAVSVGTPTPAGDTVLVSYVTARPGRIPSPERILDHAVAHLPAHFVPHTVHVLEEMPLTRTGKIDRRKLPAVEISPSREYVAPRSGLEAVVAQIFADVLGLHEVSVHDGFFELGGSSLSATKVTHRVEQHLDRRVPLSVFFENSTVAGLVAALSGDTHAAGRTLTPRERPHMVDLTGVQRGLWSINQIAQESSAYNIGLTLELDGELDVPALAGAVGDLVRQHESLRTRYPLHDGRPVQVIVPAGEALRDFVIDVTDIDERDVEAEVAAVVEPGFDLTGPCAVRAAVLRVASERHLLVFVVHHINADGESLGQLGRDLTQAYARRVGDRAERPRERDDLARRVQFADYAIWHAERLAARGLDGRTEEQRQLGYWGERLGGAPEFSGIPTDRPRSAQPRHVGGVVDLTIPSSTATVLKQLARVHNTTQFVVLHAALAVVVGRLSGRDDVVIGTPFAGRDDPALATMVGMLATTVPLRTKLTLDEPFEQMLRRVRTEDVADLANADVSFDQIVDHLAGRGQGIIRRPGLNPLFSVMLAYQNLDMSAVELEGLTVRPRPSRSFAAKVDLEVMLYPDDVDGVDRDGALGGQIVFDVELFERATIEQFADRYRNLLRAIAESPSTPVGDLAIWAGDEAGDPTALSDVEADLHDIVSQVAAVAPDAVIGVPGAPEVTFADLEATAVAMSTTVPDEDPAEALTIAVATLLADADRTIEDVFDCVRAAAATVLGAEARDGMRANPAREAGTRNRVEPA